jgi:hypothetical protein
VSEYQHVEFRAIDGPVSTKNLAYMRRQSTRAEITPWSFINEYQYGDFGGDAVEMMHRGYDLHLHYANFGVRSLYIRLPHGFPNSKSAKPYFTDDSIRFLKDRDGSGGTLAIRPNYEPGEHEELWDLGEILDRLAPLRSEILEGDLRPLYLAHLAVSCDSEHDPEETLEAPVPAGLAQPTKAQRELLNFYEISEALVAAAAQEFAPVPSKADSRPEFSNWVSRQNEATKNAWLTELMGDSTSKLRADILAQFRNDQSPKIWPTVRLDRTIAELQSAANEIQQATDKKAAAVADRKRAKKLANMAVDPTPYLQETEQLVAQRTTEAYQQVGHLLADLREALSETGRADLAERQAQKLKTKNPTLRHLAAALRRQGFVPK